MYSRGEGQTGNVKLDFTCTLAYRSLVLFINLHLFRSCTLYLYSVTFSCLSRDSVIHFIRIFKANSCFILHIELVSLV